MSAALILIGLHAVCGTASHSEIHKLHIITCNLPNIHIAIVGLTATNHNKTNDQTKEFILNEARPY